MANSAVSTAVKRMTGTITDARAGAAGLRGGHLAVVVQAAERQHDAEQQCDGQDAAGGFCTAPSRMSSSTTPRG